MLKIHSEIGPRTAYVESTYKWPPRDVAKLHTTLEKYYADTLSNPSRISNHPRATTLREEILADVPELRRLAKQVLHLLETTHSALILKAAHLTDFDLDTKRRLLYVMSLALGWPTPTDSVGKQVIWDVKNRRVPQGQVSTFSENAHAARLHTDTQYFSKPERYTLLYVVLPAVNGGVSIVRDGRDVKKAMLRSDQGKWAIAYLTKTQLPFRIPTTYTRERRQDTPEITYAPVFSDRPKIRYRKDTLEAGLIVDPRLDTAETRRALGILENALEDPGSAISTALPADSLLISNNHEGLHGRTEFSDPDRHLIRIRISDVPA